MNHKWTKDSRNQNYNLDGLEKGPFVKEIILPSSLYKHALKRGSETYKEVGFYLIGLFKKGICYIYDLVEFEYSEQSGGFIESGLARYLRLKVGLPLGLRIIGHMHKHPGFTQYSATDKRNFLQYGHANPLNAFLIFIVNPKNQISGYTATAEKIFPVKVTIRDLTSDERLIEKEIKIKFNSKILLPKNSTSSDFNLVFSEKIGSESLKFLSRPTIQINGTIFEKNFIISENSKIKIIPRKAIEIENVGKNNTLRYRVFLEEEETLADLEKILKRLTYLPQKKGYDIVFYEEGRKLLRDMKIKDINHPLVWGLEKSVLQIIFKNFYRFWKKIIGILKQKETKEGQKDLIESEVEVNNQVSRDKIVKSRLQIIFKNFCKFWSDIIIILERGEAENIAKIEDIQNSVEIPSSDSKKKRKELKRDSLDYFI